MYYKCELGVGASGVVYDVTDDLCNWDDVELDYSRTDLTGVVRSFSSKFEFAGEAYSLLLGEYEGSYLGAQAEVTFYKRNNSWMWVELFRCSLDFSTLSHDGHKCSINAVDNSLAALIKAKKGTQYEYSAYEMSELLSLKYDRLNMKSMIKWIDGGTVSDDGTYSEVEIPVFSNITTNVRNFPVYVSSSEISVQGDVEFNDLDMSTAFEGRYLSDSFFTVNKTTVVSIYCDAEFEMPAVAQDLTVTLYKTDLTKENVIVLASAQLIGYGSAGNLAVNDMLVFAMGDRLCISIKGSFGDAYNLKVNKFSLEVSFLSRGDAVYLPVVDPVTLLNRLLKSMNGGKDGFTGKISMSGDSRLPGTKLLAAEILRGISNAKLYTSYTKFVNWMSAVFGYVPVVGDDTVTFVHRSELFRDEEVKNLGGGLSGFEYSVNSSMIYSRVRVGYDKVDYDSVNGKDEFRFTNEYTTGVTLTDSSLELISPYRADAYGIEFLLNKRGEETTDDESDNDVFMIGVKTVTSPVMRYELDRSLSVTGVLSPATMFNVMYSQRYMLAANEGLIGSFSSLLEYASSDGNSDVVVDGVAGNSDVAIGDGLFTVGQVDVETSDLSVPDDLSGYVVVENGGRTYKGFVRDVGLNVGREERVKYSLIVKELIVES